MKGSITITKLNAVNKDDVYWTQNGPCDGLKVKLMRSYKFIKPSFQTHWEALFGVEAL